MSFSWQHPIYLASLSPRRFELLQQIGVEFERITIDVDETRLPNEKPDVYVQRLARCKSQTGWQSIGERELRPVLGADTVVVIDGEILGKPKHKADGIAMLSKLSGKQHQVLTAVALTYEHTIDVLSVSEVWFRAMSRDEIESYWLSGEPADKAGAYGIQGLGGAFIEKIHGCHSSIMGLPLLETTQLIQSCYQNLLK